MSPAVADSRDTQVPPYRLRHYAPGLTQAAHRHEQPHVSIIIAGSVAEASGDNEACAAAGSAVLRREGFCHEVRYGSGGALILSAPVGRAAAREAPQGEWSIVPPALIAAALRSAVCGQPDGVIDAVWDVVAAGTFTRRRPPEWLLRARDELIEENGRIADLAERSGVHRVHFSRLFHDAFGEPPSVHRWRVRALRAAAAAGAGATGVDAAHMCGFSDQSHMCRTVRQAIGTTYSKLRQLRAQVTSVQDSARSCP